MARQKVEKSLSSFLEKNLSDGELDDIVLTYVVGILNDLGHDEASSFDLEEFIDIMVAYMPAFRKLDSAVVESWLFDLAAQLVDDKNVDGSADLIQVSSGESKEQVAELADCLETFACGGDHGPTHSNGDPADHLHALQQDEKSPVHQKIIQNPLLPWTISASSTTDHKSHSVASSDQRAHPEKDAESRKSSQHECLEDKVTVLQEMFPDCCRVELLHCLGLAKNVADAAVPIILDRRDAGQAIKSHAAPQSTKQQATQAVSRNEEKLKERVLAQYSYIDLDDDLRKHTPHMKKTNDKKLVRYLDNKVVNTKGARFTELKGEENSEEMKKTYINLKPARQYRFH